MTTIKNTTGTKAVNISTDATGTVRAMYVQIYNGHEQVERQDLHNWLCETLGTYDKLIVVLTFTEGLTMLEIGHTLGYSESRVSQRLKQILAVLKCKLDCEDDAGWLRAG